MRYFFNRTISNFDIYIEIFDTIRYQCRYRYRNDFDTISTLISIFRCKYRNLYRNSMLFVKKARFFDKNIEKSRFSIKISKNLVFNMIRYKYWIISTDIVSNFDMIRYLYRRYFNPISYRIENFRYPKS